MIVLFPLCKFLVEFEKAGSEVQILQEMVHGHLCTRDSVVPV